MQIHTRKDYTHAGLNEAAVAASPIDQFTQWLTEAMESNMHEPYAMTVATVDADHRPSARVVLLRGVDARGFVFFSNYESRKGQALAAYRRLRPSLERPASQAVRSPAQVAS